jgi:hypothetical protein
MDDKEVLPKNIWNIVQKYENPCISEIFPDELEHVNSGGEMINCLQYNITHAIYAVKKAIQEYDRKIELKILFTNVGDISDDQEIELVYKKSDKVRIIHLKTRSVNIEDGIRQVIQFVAKARKDHRKIQAFCVLKISDVSQESIVDIFGNADTKTMGVINVSTEKIYEF